jgi:hypothetical protein
MVKILLLALVNRPSSVNPHPLAEQRGRYPNIEWSVDISEPEDLLTLVGSTEKITIYCRRDDPTIEIDDEKNEIDDEENEIDDEENEIDDEENE